MQFYNEYCSMDLWNNEYCGFYTSQAASGVGGGSIGQACVDKIYSKVGQWKLSLVFCLFVCLFFSNLIQSTQYYVKTKHSLRCKFSLHHMSSSYGLYTTAIHRTYTSSLWCIFHFMIYCFSACITVNACSPWLNWLSAGSPCDL